MKAVRRSGGRRRRYTLLGGLIAGLTGVFAFAIPASAQAQEPWACDNVAYVTQFDNQSPEEGTTFNRADILPDGTVDLVPLGVFGGGQLNAIGFRAQDGLMYGFFNNPDGDNAIIRISQNANGEPVFENMGLPAASPVQGTVTGMVMADGRYAIQGGDDTAIFDVSGDQAVLDQTLTAAVSGEVPGGDWAVNPVDGEIYHGESTVHDGDPANGDLWRYEIQGNTLVRAERVSDTVAGGAQWFVADGTYFSYLNGNDPAFPDAAGIYRTDLETGEVTKVADGPPLSNVDGASCANNLEVTKDADPRTVVAGSEVTYTYTVTSRGLFENPVEFVDQLPAGMTFVPGGVTVAGTSGSQFDTPNVSNGTLELSGTMAPGASATITATVAVAPDIGCGIDVENQAEATMSAEGLPPVTIVSDDPTTLDEVGDPTTIGVECEADLAIAKSAPGTVDPGGQIEWTITVTNNGPSASSGSTVTDTIPAGVTNAATSTPGCNVAGDTVTCTLGELAPGASTEIVVIGQAPETFSTQVENEATVEGNEDDPDPGNDTDTSTTGTRGPMTDLTVSKSGPGRVDPGGQIDWTITVINNGPDPSSGSTVTDTLPARVSDAATSTPGCSISGRTVECAVGALAAGASTEIALTATAPERPRTRFNNRVTVEGNEPDPEPGNDNDRTEHRTRKGGNGGGKPRLKIAKRAGTSTARPGEVVSYRIRVRNRGRAAARRVRVCDRLPSGLRLMKARGAKSNAKRACWRIRRLGAGRKRTFRVTAKVRTSTDSGRVRNRASVNARNARRARDKAGVKVRPAPGACPAKAQAAC